MSIKYKIIPVVFLVLLSSCVGMSNRTSDTGEVKKIQSLNQLNGIYTNSSKEFIYQNDKMYLSPIVLPDVNKGASNWKEVIGDIEYIKITNINNNQIKVEGLNKQFQTIASKTYASGEDFKFEEGEIKLKSEAKPVVDGVGVGVDYYSKIFTLNDKNNILLKNDRNSFGLGLWVIPIVDQTSDYFQFERIK